MAADVDVVVVGGGPAGLMLACELALAKVRVRVLEQRPERMDQSRALTLHPRSLEILDQRGMVGRFLGRGSPIPTGHFAILDTRLDFSSLDTRHPYTLFLPQVETEEILEERARELGAEILRGHAVVGLTAGEDGVALRVEGPEGTSDVRARYVVGCDGAGSVVRRSIGVAFPGTDATLTAFLGDVELADPPARPVVKTGPRGGVLLVPLGKGVHRFVVIDPLRMHAARSEPVTLDELRSSSQRILGTDFGMRHPRWLSRFGNATRLAERYRLGRVFLAGDAAHIHFPAGGQGLNVALQDAMNLGWKLAAAIEGWAPPDLLDSYHEERHPVGRALVRNTEAQVRLMDMSEPGMALRDMLSDLLTIAPVNHRLAAQISALDVAYPPAGSEATNPWVGKRVPDRALETDRGARRLYELLHAGRYVLLDLAGDADLRSASAPWGDRAELVRARVEDPGCDLASLTAVLVRPDGHVAWATDEARPAARLDELRGALARRCGPADMRRAAR